MACLSGFDLVTEVEGVFAGHLLPGGSVLGVGQAADPWAHTQCGY